MRCSINKTRRDKEYERRRCKKKLSHIQQVCLIHNRQRAPGKKPSNCFGIINGNQYFCFFSVFGCFIFCAQATNKLRLIVCCAIMIGAARRGALIKFIVPNSIYVNQRAIFLIRGPSLVCLCLNLRIFSARDDFFLALFGYTTSRFFISCTVSASSAYTRSIAY